MSCVNTPAQVRKERKNALKPVRKSLNDLETLTEKLERLINRILSVKKRLPDIDDATEILQQLRQVDKQLDVVIRDATSFSQATRTT